MFLFRCSSRNAAEIGLKMFYQASVWSWRELKKIHSKIRCEILIKIHMIIVILTPVIDTIIIVAVVAFF